MSGQLRLCLLLGFKKATTSYRSDFFLHTSLFLFEKFVQYYQHKHAYCHIKYSYLKAKTACKTRLTVIIGYQLLALFVILCATSQFYSVKQKSVIADALVIGCTIGPGRSHEVVSRSSEYNAVGEFRCRNSGILFYSNKTRVVSNKTKCLVDWTDSDIVQCWTGE